MVEIRSIKVKVLTFKAVNHRLNQPLKMTWDKSCELCIASFPNANIPSRQNAAEDFYSGLTDRIKEILNERKLHQKNLTLADILRNTPRLIGDVSRTMAELSEEFQHRTNPVQINLQDQQATPHHSIHTGSSKSAASRNSIRTTIYKDPKQHPWSSINLASNTSTFSKFITSGITKPITNTSSQIF